MSRKPRIARGIPIGAATMDTERTMPAIMNTRPSTAPITRPVSLKKKLITDQTIMNGSKRMEVLLRFESTGVSFLSPKNVQTNILACNKKSGAPG